MFSLDCAFMEPLKSQFSSFKSMRGTLALAIPCERLWKAELNMKYLAKSRGNHSRSASERRIFEYDGLLHTVDVCNSLWYISKIDSLNFALGIVYGVLKYIEAIVDVGILQLKIYNICSTFIRQF